MLQLHRQTLVAVALAALGTASTSAMAASYTIDFKNFFNTATLDNLTDTKTLALPVARLTISDLADGSGVQLTLKQNNHSFDNLNGAGNFVDALWLKAPVGTLVNVSGAALDTAAGYSATGTVKEIGYRYNWNIDFAGASFVEGQTAVLQLIGTGLTADALADAARMTPFMLSLGNVGGAYGQASLGNVVNFVGFPPVAAVPEPTSVVLMGLGLVGIAVARRSRLKSA